MWVEKQIVVELPSKDRIGVKITGNTDKPVVLLLNGSIFNYHQFDLVYRPKMMKYMGKERYCFLQYDYTGYGKSSKYRGDFDFLNIVNECIALLDLLQVDKVHTFGLSKGSIIGQILAARNPERVLSLAGYGNPNLANPESRDGIESDYSNRLQLVHALKDIYDEDVNEENFEMVYNKVYAPIIFDKTIHQLSVGEKIMNWWVKGKLRILLMGSSIAYMDKLFAYYLRKITDEEKQRYIDGMKSIHQPTLLLHGTNDETIPVSSSKLLHKWIENSELHLFDGYKHSRPLMIPWEGAKISRRYSDFLMNLENGNETYHNLNNTIRDWE